VRLFDLVFMTALPDLLYLMLRCFILTTSCHAVWSSLYHVRLHDVVFMMLGCLTLSTSCYAAWPCLRHVKLLDVLSICLCCLNLTSWRYAAWSSLPHATLLNLPYRSSVPHATLLKLPYRMYCLMSSISGCAIWSGLRNSRLFDLLYLLLRCWAFPTSGQGSGCPLKYVMLFDLGFKMLHCLISSASCYAASPPSLPLVAVWFSISDLCFLVIWSCLHDAKLFNLLGLMLHSWPSLPYVMLLDVLYISGFAISSGLHNDRLLDLLYLLSGCWTYAIWSWSQDVTLFDLIRLMLRCLAAPYLLLLCGSLNQIFSFWLFDLVFMMLSCLIFSASCYVLDLPCLIWDLVFKVLCCFIFSTSC
jgi:hypothetical protein